MKISIKLTNSSPVDLNSESLILLKTQYIKEKTGTLQIQEKTIEQT